MTRRLAIAAVVALALPPATLAQGYTAAHLDCARYRETSRSEIETESAGRVRRAVAEREGWWRFRARDTAGGVALEGWYDSLALRHGSGDTLSSPDTDGIIGGRYRGLLRSGGAYERLAVPFVPDEVAEAADAAAALDDLLPPAPPTSLAVGARWSDGHGLEIERLSDSAAGARPLRRYVLRRRSESDEAMPSGDTVPVPLRQTTDEESRIVWDAASGLVRRERETVTDASAPAGGRLRTPIRSRVVQRAELVRVAAPRDCR